MERKYLYDKRNNIFLRKKLLQALEKGKLNEELLIYINKARHDPIDFSRILMIDDDVKENIRKLSLFFLKEQKPCFPLVLDKKLSKCSDELLSHIINIDNGKYSIEIQQKDKDRLSLKKRLEKYNLIPGPFKELILIGAENAYEAITSILLNENNKNKLLNPNMTFIGISSGFLPSERICIVVELVQSLKEIKNISPKFTKKLIFNQLNRTQNNNISNSISSRNIYKNNLNLKSLNSELINSLRKKRDLEINFNKYSQDSKQNLFRSSSNGNVLFYLPTKQVFFSENYQTNYKKHTPSKNGRLNTLTNSCKTENTFINESIRRPKVRNIVFTERKKGCNNSLRKKKFYSPVPVSISIEKSFEKDEDGELKTVYTKQTYFNDGSLLIQPTNNSEIK